MIRKSPLLHAQAHCYWKMNNSLPDLRAERSWTQGDLAKHLGVSRASILPSSVMWLSAFQSSRVRCQPRLMGEGRAQLLDALLQRADPVSLLFKPFQASCLSIQLRSELRGFFL